MLELRPSKAAVIACLGALEALDAIVLDGTFPCRVAPDELLLLGRPGVGGELLERALARLAELDPGGVAVDQSDGWSAYTLAGSGRNEAYARLSAVPLPRERPTFVQGAVAGLQAKIVADDDCLHLLVVSSVGHHLRHRLATVAADLGIREAPSAALVVRPAVAARSA